MRGATTSIKSSGFAPKFQSTLLMRGATSCRGGRHRGHDISIHAPHARSDRLTAPPRSQRGHFNPRSSCEERPATTSCMDAVDSRIFQSTLLMRGATCASIDLFLCLRAFQSTLLMRGATARLPYSYQAFRISIHAPHARSDVLPDHRWPRRAYFNPRSSCEERPTKSQLSGLKGIFQSTLLMRGATLTVPMTIAPTIDFNPRSSCEERRTASASTRSRADFNPRSSCEERRGVISLKTADRIFQSTLLMRGATGRQGRRRRQYYISIHAPHARSDQFHPLPGHCCTGFQSTLLMRGATGQAAGDGFPQRISIHAPHARSDD